AVGGVILTGGEARAISIVAGRGTTAAVRITGERWVATRINRAHEAPAKTETRIVSANVRTRYYLRVMKLQVTDKALYLNRREFIAAATAAIGVAAAARAGAQPAVHGRRLENVQKSPLSTDER